MRYISALWVLCVIAFLSGNISAQNITYTEVPSVLQLFPRDAQDSAAVAISGTVDITGFDSIFVEVDTNSVLWKRKSQHLIYSGGTASFTFSPKIFTDTINFSFEIFLKQDTVSILDTLIERVVCGDVYFINGQSNAAGKRYGSIYGDSKNEWVRSFGHSSRFKYNDTNWYLANRLDIGKGGVGNWGIRLGILMATNQGIPVCIIQQAKAGEAIAYFTDGIGGDTLPNDYNFDNLLFRASNAGVTNDVKAIFWWQGEADVYNTTLVNNYQNQFLTLFNAWKTYYPNIQKIYTTQIHPGYGLYCDQIREIQRQIAEDSSMIEIITPYNLGYFLGEHFEVPGYQNYAAKLYKLVSRDFYGSNDTVDIDPPNITRAYFTDSNKNVMVLQFDNTNPLTFKEDTTIGSITYYLKDHFYFHNGDATIDTAIVDSIAVYTNKVRLALAVSSNATSISNIPAQYYNPLQPTPDIYDGPWLTSSQGVGGLTFYKFPIDTGFGEDPMSPAPIVARIKVYLEGPYDTAGDTMANALNPNLPLTQPYGTAPWNYSGTESVISMPDSIVDWVLVELRSGISSTTTIDTSAGLLTKTGEITDMDGNKGISFQLSEGNYYIVVHHRNHLSIMTSVSQLLNSSANLYDFTASSGAAYESGATKMLESGVYGMITGDANGNGQVQNDDKNAYWKTEVGTAGYKSADFNLNGQVQNDDKNTFWKSNVGRGTQVP